MPFLKLQGQSLFKFWITFQCHERYLVHFGQKMPIERKFSDFWVVGWKLTKFLMLSLKLQVSFSLNFASLFSFMRDNSSVHFSWNFIWFGQKEPITVQNVRFLTAHVKFHQSCNLIVSFCWKYVKIHLKK